MGHFSRRPEPRTNTLLGTGRVRAETSRFAGPASTGAEALDPASVDGDHRWRDVVWADSDCRAAAHAGQASVLAEGAVSLWMVHVPDVAMNAEVDARPVRTDGNRQAASGLRNSTNAGVHPPHHEIVPISGSGPNGNNGLRLQTVEVRWVSPESGANWVPEAFRNRRERLKREVPLRRLAGQETVQRSEYPGSAACDIGVCGHVHEPDDLG